MERQLPVPFELLSPKQVAKILKCSLPWVYKASESGLLPSVRIPCPGTGTKKKNMVRFELEAVREFIRRHSEQGR
jgi:hypothetical protein